MTAHEKRPSRAPGAPFPPAAPGPGVEETRAPDQESNPAGGGRSASGATGEAAPDLPAVAGEPQEAPAPPDADFRDRWLRTEADLQNYRRRAQRDLEESVRFAESRILLEMIAQLDDLERALATAREAGAPDPWVQGVQLVANRMIDDLARHDVVPMRPLGQRFDPERHEALLEIDAPGDVEPGHIVQVVREGYLRGGRALRAARVVVARRPEGSGA